MNRIRRRAVISGRVQGVGFRVYCVGRAEEAGLAGWVLNMPDGSVQTEIEGPADAVERFLKDMEQGPRWARVDAVDTREVPALRDTAERFRIVDAPPASISIEENA